MVSVTESVSGMACLAGRWGAWAFPFSASCTLRARLRSEKGFAGN